MKGVSLLLAIIVLASGCISHSGGDERMKLEVGSVFHDGSYIPRKFTCDGEDINPPLYLAHIPGDAKSIVIIVDDPDAPIGTFTHWIAWNIPPIEEIPEGIPKRGTVDEPIKMIQGRNDFGRIGYGGPCPPRGKAHHYHFRVYALDTTLSLPPGAGRKDLERAMKGHVIEWGELVGLYERK